MMPACTAAACEPPHARLHVLAAPAQDEPHAAAQGAHTCAHAHGEVAGGEVQDDDAQGGARPGLEPGFASTLLLVLKPIEGALDGECHHRAYCTATYAGLTHSASIVSGAKGLPSHTCWPKSAAAGEHTFRHEQASNSVVLVPVTCSGTASAGRTYRARGCSIQYGHRCQPSGRQSSRMPHRDLPSFMSRWGCQKPSVFVDHEDARERLSTRSMAWRRKDKITSGHHRGSPEMRMVS